MEMKERNSKAELTRDIEFLEELAGDLEHGRAGGYVQQSDELREAMSNDMKSTSQTHRDIATVLGSDLGNAGFPMLLAFMSVGLTIKPFKDSMPGILLVGLYIGGSLLLGLLLMHFYVGFNGKRILKAVEKDYGSKTRQHVFNAFEAAKPGDKIDLDIPGIARAYRENKEYVGNRPAPPTVHLDQCVAISGLPGCTCRETESASMLNSAFTEAELLEIEQALEGHDSADPLFKAAIDSAFLKVGIALNRPWALKKLRENA